MTLQRYRKKRDFSKTPEPKGRREKHSSRLRFVVQKHDATRLHYDFRLELDGVLKSWAVPKGPSLDPGQKRLAVEVEDHPLDYASFEGVIPAGQYGGGTVLVWDEGTWTAEKDPVRGLAAGKLEFSLNGSKLSGSWTLVRMRTRETNGAKGDRNWLLMKRDDDAARPERDFDVTRDEPNSVVSGRDLAKVKSAEDRTWNSHRTRRKGGSTAARRSPRARASAVRAARRTRASRPAKNGRKIEPEESAAPVDPATIEGARRAHMPNWIEPQLATLVDSAPSGKEWLHETKFDGYRALCRITRGRARWFTRNGNDWTTKFASLSGELERLAVKEAWIDGEVVILRPDGTTSFQDLQNAFRGTHRPNLTYCVFDLLHLDGFDLRPAPLHARKSALERIVHGAGSSDALRYSAHVEGSGPEMIRAACLHHLEGIVSKRRDGPYRSGRGHGWVKTKCSLEQEFVIGGFTAPGGARRHFGALLLGYYEGRKLRFAGRVGTGFDDRTLKTVRSKLSRLERDEPAFIDPPVGADARGVQWVDPDLVAAIHFTGWTDDGMLRHPTFGGLREDKPAREVVRERAAKPPRAARSTKQAARIARAPISARRASTTERTAATSLSSASSRSSAKNGDVEVAGVRISHPSRVLYPGPGFTKLDLAQYYEKVSDWILPHVEGRPLNLLRCPEGSGKSCFFQRHAHGMFPKCVKSADVGHGESCVHVDSTAGLVGLVQMGVLELHPWGSKLDLLDRPDCIVFDLDPDPAVPWMRVVKTAKLLRSMLNELDLECFVKTTGGKGLHVVVPIARRYGWNEIKQFSKGIADMMARAAPDLYVATASKAQRAGKVYIDYLRNARSASSVAAYSTRAHPDATVSMPIAWDEIDRVMNDQFDVESALVRLKKTKKDPWAKLLSSKQSISATALKSVTSPSNSRRHR